MGITKKHIIIACLIVGVIIFAYFVFNAKGKQREIEGLGEPVQGDATGQVKMSLSGFDLNIKYLKSYQIDALVVGVEDYSLGGVGDDLVPRDLALVWGKVAEYNTRCGFDWSQSGRWYRWRAPSYEALKPVGDVTYVNQHSSNNHLIAADEAVKNRISKVKVGDEVIISGFLVDVSGKNDKGETFSWTSSTSRTDTGAHSCELIYVTDMDVIKQ